MPPLLINRENWIKSVNDSRIIINGNQIRFTYHVWIQDNEDGEKLEALMNKYQQTSAFDIYSERGFNLSLCGR